MLFETLDPIRHGARRIIEDSRGFTGGKPVCDKGDGVKAVQ